MCKPLFVLWTVTLVKCTPAPPCLLVETDVFLLLHHAATTSRSLSTIAFYVFLQVYRIFIDQNPWDCCSHNNVIYENKSRLCAVFMTFQFWYYKAFEIKSPVLAGAAASGTTDIYLQILMFFFFSKKHHSIAKNFKGMDQRKLNNT